MRSARCNMIAAGSSTTICCLSIVLAVSLLSHLSPAFAGGSVLQSMEHEFQAIVKSVQPSVVEIIATCTVDAPRISRNGKGLLVDDLTAATCHQDIGSGIIIDSAGHIITTAAVVKDADQIEVVFADGQRTLGEFLEVDPLTDIAVLSVESESLPQTKIGDSDQIDTGSWAITVGSSYGHSPTFSLGIVSGMEILPNRPFYDAIKINAPVNPGNSGGAVANTSGEVIGVIAATLAEPHVNHISQRLDFTPPGFSQGQSPIFGAEALPGQVWMKGEISFAIPIKVVKHINWFNTVKCLGVGLVYDLNKRMSVPPLLACV